MTHASHEAMTWEPKASSRALSVSAAAQQCPDSLCVITPDAQHTFGQIAKCATSTEHAEHVAEGPLHFRAHSDLDSLVQVLSALDAGRTFLPLHPKLTAPEADTLIARARDYRGDPALLVATSGTSGTPKLAILDHAVLAHAAHASAQNIGFHEHDRWLSCMPLAHVGGLSIVTRCLIARKPIILLPNFDAAAVLRAIQQHAATLLSVVPAMLSLLLAEPNADALRALRIILVGGAACPPELRRSAQARGLRLLATYGCTEMASQITTQRPDDLHAVESTDSGFALNGVELQLLHTDATEPRADRHSDPPRGGKHASQRDATPAAAIRHSDPPRGGPSEKVGRILVRGPMRMRGYVGEPELAADAWLDTGDLGVQDDAGRLYVIGRSDDVIVTGGENVHPAEVEAALRRDPRVRDALVCGVPDGTWGQTVAALLVLAPGARAEQVLDAASERLASFKRPRSVLVVDDLPRTRVGKPDRAAAVRRFRI